MTQATRNDSLPPIIWMLWLQGWDQAPSVARASLSSWRRRNPAWTVRALSEGDLHEYMDSEVVETIFSGRKKVQNLADLIRMELLVRHGGVWADVTTICAQPLDDWLPQAMPNGFFAFSQPAPDRMLSNWFLAAEKGSRIPAAWLSASMSYWDGRESADDYYWMHRMFEQIYRTDPQIRALWDGTPAISAQHALHFGADDGRLKRKATAALEALLRNPPSPVFKLTHKFTSEPQTNSVFARLCEYALDGAGPEPLSPIHTLWRRLLEPRRYRL